MEGISDEHPVPRHSPAAWQTLPTIHSLPQVSHPGTVSSWMEMGRGSGSPMELQLSFEHQQLSNFQAHFCLHKHSLFQACSTTNTAPSIQCHR